MAKTVNKHFSNWQVAAGFEERVREAFGGATLVDIAAKTGENYHTLRNWVKRTRHPPPEFFIAVAELTNHSPYWLLTAKGSKLIAGSNLSSKKPTSDDSQLLSPALRGQIRQEIISVLEAMLSEKDKNFADSLIAGFIKEIKESVGGG